MKAYYRNFNQDIYYVPTDKDCTVFERMVGGYGDPEFDVIYIDENLPLDQQPLVIGHEVADLNFGKQIKHSRIDKFIIEYFDCLLQLGFEIKKIPRR